MTEQTAWDLACTCRGWIHARGVSGCRGPARLSEDAARELRQRLPRITAILREAKERMRHGRRP